MIDSLALRASVAHRDTQSLRNIAATKTLLYSTPFFYFNLGWTRQQHQSFPFLITLQTILISACGWAAPEPSTVSRICSYFFFEIAANYSWLLFIPPVVGYWPNVTFVSPHPISTDVNLVLLLPLLAHQRWKNDHPLCLCNVYTGGWGIVPVPNHYSAHADSKQHWLHLSTVGGSRDVQWWSSWCYSMWKPWINFIWNTARMDMMFSYYDWWKSRNSAGTCCHGTCYRKQEWKVHPKKWRRLRCCILPDLKHTKMFL